MSFIIKDVWLGMFLAEDRRRVSGSLVWSTDRTSARAYDSRIGAEHVLREWTRTWDAPLTSRYEIQENRTDDGQGTGGEDTRGTHAGA